MIRKDESQYLQTPCYVINLDQFNANINEIKTSFYHDWGPNLIIGYSVKTNHLPFLLKHVKSHGFYAEVVSGDEYQLAINVGFNPEQIIFNGPQKNKKAILSAINNGSIVNIDNFEDVKILEENRSQINQGGSNLGLRINFDLEQICRGQTTTGKEVSRFGFCVENQDFEKALLKVKNLGLYISGIHVHFSTKTRSVSVFRVLAEQVAILIEKFGLTHQIKFIDMGGGYWGGRNIPDRPSMQEYSKQITEVLSSVVSPQRVNLILEPGASILASAVDYLAKVINIRDIRDIRIVTIDGSLYHINPLMTNKLIEFSTNTKDGRKINRQIVCGSTCLEMDRLLDLDNTIEFQKGDSLTFHFSGAYTMAFNNCFINNPPYVYVNDNHTCILVRGNIRSCMKNI